MRIEISAAARADLVQIFVDGIERFGVEQAELFQHELDRKIRLIASHPQIGAVWDDERDYRKVSHFPYLILYSFTRQFVQIERIIDGRSDHSLHK